MSTTYHISFISYSFVNVLDYLSSIKNNKNGKRKTIINVIPNAVTKTPYSCAINPR